MSKEVLKDLIDKIYQILIKFVPEDQPLSDEIEAISKGKKELENGEVKKLEDIQWDWVGRS